jgi:metal-responsive CopG/Arc/MetJ family transcriptional regulator
MPRTSRNYKAKITIQLTPHMLADLDTVAAKSGKSRAEIVRQAIRNALDDTDLTLGTKRRFDRRFQTRFDEMEKHLEQTLTRFLESTRDVFLQDVVKQALVEIKGQMARTQSQDAERMSFYLAVVALLCGKLLWQSTPSRNRPEAPMDTITEAINAASGREGTVIRDQIRSRR